MKIIKLHICLCIIQNKVSLPSLNQFIGYTQFSNGDQFELLQDWVYHDWNSQKCRSSLGTVHDVAQTTRCEFEQRFLQWRKVRDAQLTIGFRVSRSPLATVEKYFEDLINLS